MVPLRHRLRTLLVIAAGLLQLHLFCVLQLHHHGLDALELSTLGSRFDARPHAQPAEPPLLPCPACHVAEHGLIVHAGIGEVATLFAPAGDAPRPVPSRYVFLGRTSLRGRDPPRS
ncbi:MAG: hypothetical protein WAO20_20495 [Acidobacteriota bacterium]